jgi:hypothetical protein
VTTLSRAEADIERVILSLGGVKGVSATFPESVATFPVGTDAKDAKDAKLQVMEIKGMKPEDVTALVANLNKRGMTIDPKSDVIIGKDGVANIVMKTSEMTEKLLPAMKKEFEKLGEDNPGLIRFLQEQTKKVLADQGIKPSGIPLWQSSAEKDQGGGEKVIGHGSVGGTKFVFDETEDQKIPMEKRQTHQVRGIMSYDIVQTDKGDIIARTTSEPTGARIVDDKIAATVKVDGKDKTVMLSIGKNGTVPKEEAEALLKLLKQPKEQAKEEVQKKETTPAATAKAGGVVVGRGNAVGLRVSYDGPNQQAGLELGKANAVEQIGGSAAFVVERQNDGKLVAHLADNENMRIVRQEITATLDGVDGKPARTVTLKADEVGNLTEVTPPASTPSDGKGQATQQRR